MALAMNDATAPAPRGRLYRLWDSDFGYQFRRSPVAIVASVVLLVWLIAAVGAPWLAPHNTLDLATLDLIDARLPPAWLEGGDHRYLLGTDEQGRDMLSAIMFGTRISLLIGGVAVILSMLIGVILGLASGYVGGRVDAFIMRLADVQLSFPAILIALLVNGVLRVLMPRNASETLAFVVLVAAITASGWVQYARTVRGSTLVEKGRDYVLAARVIGSGRLAILFRHVLPNVIGPVLILATVQIATAIITEATLSFLGVGAPPTRPSLGTLIDNGNKYLYSGEWWITVFPGLALVMLVLSVNLLGDWLRDALNPKLQ
jgi:peptide/nickel transport system permease protein